MARKKSTQYNTYWYFLIPIKGKALKVDGKQNGMFQSSDGSVLSSWTTSKPSKAMLSKLLKVTKSYKVLVITDKQRELLKSQSSKEVLRIATTLQKKAMFTLSK